jgi:ribosome maturation protein SDO1
MANITFDPEKFQLNIIRLKKGGEFFEMAIDPDEYMKYREDNAQVEDVLLSDDIFTDVQKGLLASKEKLKSLFSDQSDDHIREFIIKEGDVHFTAAYKNMLRDKKLKQIKTIILANGVDPRTHLPIPQARFEIACESLKFKIDEFRSAKDQVKDVLKVLKDVLPIKFEQKELRIKVPAEYGAKAYGAIKAAGSLKSESWNNDGSFSCILLIPGGLEDDVLQKINSVTQSAAEIEIINRIET